MRHRNHTTPTPFKLHVPRIPPSCPMEGEGARTRRWEGKADLHRKAMKAFGSSAQPDSTLSHLSCRIYSVAIMKLTLLSQRVQEEYLTEFLPQHMTCLGLSGSTTTAHKAPPLETSLSWPSLPLYPTLSESFNHTFHFRLRFCQSLWKLLLKE